MHGGRPRWIALLAGLAALVACGRTATPAAPTAAGSTPPTPVPSVAGPTLRVRELAYAGKGTLVVTNAAPAATGRVPIALGYEADAHVTRALAERRALAAIAPPRRRLLQAAQHAVGDRLPFYVLLDTDPNTGREVKVTATCQAVGDHCYVWVDPAGMTTDAERATMAKRVQEIVQAFEGHIYATDTRLFGREPDPGIDGDPRLHILISPAVDAYGTTTTLGYFSRRDEYKAQPNGPPGLVHSNEKELINVASAVVLQGGPQDYLGTIAHEFQHMINFNQKVLVAGHPQGEDLWIDEGMAMYALEANGYGLMGGGEVLLGHVQAFQEAPSRYSLSSWEGNPGGIGYGPVYLFMVYLADRYGRGILHELVTSPDLGFANMEARLAAHGSTFAATFADWAAANLLDHVPGAPPELGYKLLDMHGTYGGVTLAGFTTEPLPASGLGTLALRPTSLIYGRLATGAALPAVAASAPAEVLPPVVVP